MCSRLEHRGPDSRGMHVDGSVGLGIQRLRVIDLTTGDQPIYNEDSTVAVVLNGEIYNFKELRSRLTRAGHRFATSGDTEVIVHLYEELGPDCVRELDGMFAFALWDFRRNQLLLARDRVGKKPLFYSDRRGVLSFASELQSLLEDEAIPRDVDHLALDCYYAYQYVPAPYSAFRAIRKLPPASRMVWRDGQSEIERYWHLDYSRKSTATKPELEDQLRELIRAAVAKRMVADVPVGAFLSGGVDSSVVVAAMAEQTSQLRTFSIGFADEAFNELPYARTVAELFGTEHHEFVVEPSAVELLPTMVRHYGEPFADASAIPSFYLAQLTRDHVTVALNGDGGDESFGGYFRYASNVQAAQLTGHVPPWLRAAIGTVSRHIPDSNARSRLLQRARNRAFALSLDGAARYAVDMSYFNVLERQRLYTPEYRHLVSSSPAPAVLAGPWAEASGSSLTDVMLEVDTRTYLPGDLLVKVDIATMAHSLEARAPLLDHEVMEFAASVPSDYKLSGGNKKVLLRDAARAWLPDHIVDRKKVGFGVPLGAWMRGELRGYVREVLLDPGTVDRGYYNETYIRELLDGHAAGVVDGSARLWALMMAELWHREFVDSPIAASGHGRS
jgi:asparagine synthase (glutamine-hydrolysing)